jgi:hypothetical protein
MDALWENKKVFDFSFLVLKFMRPGFLRERLKVRWLVEEGSTYWASLWLRSRPI